MVPGPAPADLLPRRTPETPGANGFELLPETAGSAAAQSSATVVPARAGAAASALAPASMAPSSRALTTDASGFQMTAPPPAHAPAAPALAVSPAAPMALSAPAGFALANPAVFLPVSNSAPAATAVAAEDAAPPAAMTAGERLELRAPAAAPALASATALQPVSAAAPLLITVARDEAAPGVAVTAAAPLQVRAADPAPALARAAALQPVSGAAPLLITVTRDEAATSFAVSARAPLQVRAPSTAPALSRTSGMALVAGSAPALIAARDEAAPPSVQRVLVYPDFRMDVRPDAPVLVPAMAHLKLESRTPKLALEPAQETVSLEFVAGSAVEPHAAAAPGLTMASVPTGGVAAWTPAVMLTDEAPARARPILAVQTVVGLQGPAAPMLERAFSPSATVHAAPAVFVDASDPGAVVRPDRAARLELVREAGPARLTRAVGSSLVAVAPALPAEAPEPAARPLPMERATPVSLAADAPIATAPALELMRVHDYSPALATATEAASAQVQARPVSAVAEAPRPQPQSREPAVLELAQASPPPAAPAPAPAPAEPPASPPAAAAPAAAPTGPVATAPVQTKAVVGRIIVQGNERIEASTILSYLPIQVGDTVDAAKLDLAVKTLYRTDLFADVSLEMQGSDLIVKVAENPIINEVVFEGNHAIKEDKLRDEVSVRPRGIFTRSKVEEDAQKIIELYRRSGRISATVTPKIVQLPQKRVDLIFEINEGPKTGILHINFVGNKSFSDSALRDVVVTRESHWYKFFQSQDNYDPDRLEYDREQLRKFYRNHGFYDFRIVSAVAELAPDKNGFVITFTVDEGPKYHFGKVKVTTELKRLNGELLAALLPLKSGQLYEDDRIEKATDALTYAAGANGFAFVDVRPQYVAHPETRTVDVTFDIKEGPRVYIERIDIVGNTQTLDYVIRREMRVAEGDAYNRVLVDRSKQQIKALGFFKDVDIEQLPGSAPDKTVLRVKVTEQPTGQLTFSIGYSSLEKLVGDIGISQSNFRGRGQRVDLELSMGYLEKRVQLSFTEPRFQGRNMAAGFDIYYYNYNYQTTASFSSASMGTTLRTGFPINQYASVVFNYSIHSDKVSLPSYVIDPTTHLCATGYSQSLCDEVGTTFTSSVGYSVKLDRRNDPILPTRGFYVDLNQQFAGLGGVRYIQTRADAAWYYGFTPKWVLTVQGRAGYITGWGGDSVRINDRFFMGGDEFRGFQIAGLGPRDNTLQDTNQCSSSNTASSSSIYGGCYGSALGGKAYAIGTIELTVPNPIPQQYGIKTALFTDFGTVGLLDASTKRNPDGRINPYIADNLAFRASVGISVAWKSPMGPLKFDFSKVLKKTPYDVKETFYFSTATNFQ